MDLSQGLGMLEQLVMSSVHDHKQDDAQQAIDDVKQKHEEGGLDLEHMMSTFLPKIGEMLKGDNIKEIEEVVVKLIGGGK